MTGSNDLISHYPGWPKFLSEEASVLQQMIDDRLLTTDDDDDRGEPRVDLAHEIMIAAWPTLAGWIQSHRIDEQRRRQLESAAAEWAKHGRGARGLLDPIELADAEAWQQTQSARELAQSAEVTALLAASRAAQAKQRRRRRLIVSAMGLWGLVAVFVAARRQADYAHEQTLRAEASDRKNHELVAAASRDVLGGEAALGSHPGPRASGRGSELRVQPGQHARGHRERGHDRAGVGRGDGQAAHQPLAHQAAVRSAAFSPDGTRVVTASVDKTARVWDAATGEPLTLWRSRGNNRPSDRSPGLWAM